MNTVFVLQHEYEWHGQDEVKFLGVYASRAEAEAAVDRLRRQSGFRDWPDGFSIDDYEIGVDHWVEGFVELVNILVPSKHDAHRYQVATSVWRPGDLHEISELEDPEQAAFSVNDVVRCETRAVAGHGEAALVAVELVRPPETSGPHE